MANKDLEQRVEGISKWGSLIKAFEEKPYDKKIRAAVAADAVKDPTNPENKGIAEEFANEMSQEDFYQYLQANVAETQKELIKYSQANINSILAEVKDGDFLNLTLGTIKPVVDGDASKAHEDYTKAKETLDKKKIGEMREYLLELVKEEYRDTFRPLLENDEAVMRMYSGVADGRKLIFANEFARNGELNRKGLEDYAQRNLRQAKEEDTYNFYLNATMNAYQTIKDKDSKEERARLKVA